MKIILQKYKLVIIASLLTAAFIFSFLKVYHHDYRSGSQKFQKNFTELEQKLNVFIKRKAESLRFNDVSELWRHLKKTGKNDFFLHVYKNDSLVFWNTNKLPILRFADIHFPTEGTVRLQNGWYYTKIKKVRDYLVVGSFRIKWEYAYQNKNLNNTFHKNLSLPFSAYLSLDESVGYPIYAKNGNYVFSLVPNEYQKASHTEAIILTLLLLLSISAWLLVLFHLLKRVSFPWVFVFALVIIRYLSIKYTWFGFMHGTPAFDADIYATNEYFPNFFEFLVNVAILCFISFVFIWEIKQKRYFKKQWIALSLFISTVFLWGLFVYLVKGLVLNSSIPLEINQLFSLNIFSLFTFFSLGLLFYVFFRLVFSISKLCLSVKITGTQLSVVSFFVSCFYCAYEIIWGEELFIAAIFPFFFYELIVYLTYRNYKKTIIVPGVLLLFLFSITLVSILTTFNERKEKEARKVYANLLINEKNIVTEIEYNNIREKLSDDNFLKKFISRPRFISISDFQEGIERRVFNSYWDRYELSFHLFNENHLPLIGKVKEETKQFDELNNIILNSGKASEIDSNIYYIEDYTKQYSYIIRQELRGKDSSKAILFVTLKSKKIPEEIGFPRLLISKKSNALKSLEQYDIARYHKGQLITKYGDYPYPFSPFFFIPKRVLEKTKGFFSKNGYNHYALIKNEGDIVILSKKEMTLLDFITSFSYLFTFYGLFLLPLLFKNDQNKQLAQTLSLAVKIQIVLIGLVFISLLAFGWGSGLFVTSQYHEMTEKVIKEKLSSIEKEVQGKLKTYDYLDIVEHGNFMQYILRKFSSVFMTDINLYDTNGYLLATSRPKVFNKGLLSEQINPVALKHLEFLKESEFINQEKIGDLIYTSAYKPFFNEKGKLHGYINLQHFGKQREFEEQIQQFLVAIINVFILLLALSILLAIFISNWITLPLRRLQENFLKIQFGKKNEKLHYDNKDDEIGQLVNAYNNKLEELEYTANQLAKSERESAWKEMAKQVAHEIKNPLTPMKLSVQQLLRAFDPNDPNGEEKLKKVASSIIEQIDALTKIANEFSNFAKMPSPNYEKINLVDLIKTVVSVFSSSLVDVSFTYTHENIKINGDKDQLIRVFNNLIKNAIQAIEESGKNGKVEICLSHGKNGVHISIKDNGIGIPDNKKEKIFVPYFTTKSTGTGIGLAIVKQIIENHKGTVSFESKEGEGTVFNIHFFN